MIRKVATIVAFATGLFMLVQYFLNADIVSLIYRALLDYYQIIFAMTMIVGGITLFLNHARTIAHGQRAGWYSGATIAAILFMIIAALIYGTGADSPYQWAFNNMQAPMQATTFSLLAFFVASAAYRGFRVRSRAAAVLAISALLVLIGRNAFGEMISEYLPQAAGWLLNHPSVAAKRGILIGIGLGSVATALRVILGIERTYL
ncbi:MAG: hypothetical protein KAT58_05210 [candidate division Zixibacteria bacterium]|nr:hypothetical protein [candidate division Zixibacteria bacterium]